MLRRCPAHIIAVIAALTVAPCALPSPVALPEPTATVVRYARGFRVATYGGYRVVTADPGFGIRPTRLLLVPRGAPIPALTGEYAGAIPVAVPVRSVGVWLNEDAALLTLLGVADRITITGPRAHYPELQAGYRSGRIRSTGPSLNFEAVLDANPDLVLTTAAIQAHDEVLDSLRALHLAAVGNYSWLEPTPLGRAEWIKFAALFFHREREADALFAEVEGAYRTESARARTASVKPAVFWATPTGANWSCSRNDWEAQLIQDAGAVNVLADHGPTRVVPLSDEFIVQTASDADYWITLDPGTLADGHSWRSFRSFQSGRVYDPYRSIPALGGAEFSGIAGYRPDLLLKDLISIFHPELLPDYRPVFFQRKARLGR